MKKLMLLAATILSSAFLVACGNGSGGDNNNGGVVGCYAPNYWQNNVCITPGTGGSNRTFYDGNYYIGISNGNLRITDPATYKDFLKVAMAVCDRWSKDNWGKDNCNTWTSGQILIGLSVSGTNANQATLSFMAAPGYNSCGGLQCYGGWGVITGLPMQNPLALASSPISVINTYQGFEIRRNINLGLIQLIVTNGKLEDNTLSYQLAWGSSGTGTGKVFATGTLTRSAY